jgi:glycosyltransferase 2 family protein
LKKVIITAAKFLLFLGIGVFIFWMIYKDQDPARIINILKNNVNYTWVWISLGLGIISHVSRTLRWISMIEPLGKKPGTVNTFLAVMIGYLMNLVLPRMGEISRCGILSRYENISFTKLLGTVVTERIVDVIMLLIFTLVVLFTQFGQIMHFLHNNPEIEMQFRSILLSPYLFAGIGVIIVLFFILRKSISNTLVYKKIRSTAMNFKEGLMSIRNIKRKGTFIFHSVFIWTLYYLMLYTLFFAFDFTKDLSPISGLTTFVLASYGMVAPVQGGIGAWHFMAKESLKLYGVANENGIIFALVAHTSMTVLIIVVGLAAWMILPFINRSSSVKK